jgi:hypothetical protein
MLDVVGQTNQGIPRFAGFQLILGGAFELVLHDKNSIDYLLKLKFGYIGPFIPSTSQLGSSGSNIEQQNRQHLIEKYRKELTNLTTEEFERILNGEKVKEAQSYIAKRDADEAARPFNQARANLDVEHWSRISFWTQDEAVAISLNRDPRRVSWDALKSVTGVSAFAAKYQAKLMLVERAKEMGQLWAKTTPIVFLAWAERMRFEMPVELVGSVKALGVQVADWKTFYDTQVQRTNEANAEIQALNEKSLANGKDHIAFLDRMRVGYDELLSKHVTTNSSLGRELADATLKIQALQAEQRASNVKTTGTHPRVKDTLLKMIIGMAVDCYGYDPKQARSPFPRELSDILMTRGLNVSDDTIRSYLKEAAQLLPPPQTE